MLYEVAYCPEFIYINVYSSNIKVNNLCPMSRLYHESVAND